MQWDIRWGYKIYGDDVAGLTACGPTCLSMVAVYLLQDTKYSPDYMIDWADKNGYCVDGGGSLWTLMSEGAEKLGIDSTELPLDKQRVINNLEVGNPVVCIMGPGDFTKKGHFIVMTGIEDGKIKINDPNSFEIQISCGILMIYRLKLIICGQCVCRKIFSLCRLILW